MDNAATTVIRSEVLQTMLPFMHERLGNPSSIHREGRLARKAIERARGQVADMINVDPSEIVFTSGGTESNNMAIRGAARSHPGGHIITTKIEHDSILSPCKHLERDHTVTYLEPDTHGKISPESLISAITDDTWLVSIMTANNEVGTIQSIIPLVQACKTRSILFHTDMVQAAGKIPTDVRKIGVDMASISAHKIGGPKGAGALYARKGILDPILHGGGQERGLRSGTENVPGIVGFGEACRLAKAEITVNEDKIKRLRDDLVRKITATIPHVVLNGHPVSRLPGNANLAFLGVNGEDLIIKLDEYNIAASTGSACSVHRQKESHVLRAMGLSQEIISSSLRLTLGPDNNEKEVDAVVSALRIIVPELRAVSPLRSKYG